MSWQEWNVNELPGPIGPTDDLAVAKRQLDELGYVVLSNVLSADETQQVRRRLHEQAEAERALGIATLFTPSSLETLKQLEALQKAGKSPEGLMPQVEPDQFFEQFIGGLLNKGEEFWNLLLLPRIQELTAHVIGTEFLLSSWLGSIVQPGCPLMGLHTDQWYMNQPHARSAAPKCKSGDMTRAVTRPELDGTPSTMITPAYSVQTIWMLTDFTEKDGATRIIPRSHLSGAVPEATVPHPYRSVAAGGPAGSVLLYDARLWHSSGEHKGAASRYALHGTFVGPQIRQMENFSLGLLPEVRRKLPQRLIDMLGYKLWWGYGRTDSFAIAGHSDPDRKSTGRLQLAKSYAH